MTVVDNRTNQVYNDMYPTSYIEFESRPKDTIPNWINNGAMTKNEFSKAVARLSKGISKMLLNLDDYREGEDEF